VDLGPRTQIKKGKGKRQKKQKQTVSCDSSTGSEATESKLLAERGGIAQGSERPKKKTSARPSQSIARGRREDQLKLY
jgi:hypothetical protein